MHCLSSIQVIIWSRKSTGPLSKGLWTKQNETTITMALWKGLRVFRVTPISLFCGLLSCHMWVFGQRTGYLFGWTLIFPRIFEHKRLTEGAHNAANAPNACRDSMMWSMDAACFLFLGRSCRCLPSVLPVSCINNLSHWCTQWCFWSWTLNHVRFSSTFIHITLLDRRVALG